MPRGAFRSPPNYFQVRLVLFEAAFHAFMSVLFSSRYCRLLRHHWTSVREILLPERQASNPRSWTSQKVIEGASGASVGAREKLFMQHDGIEQGMLVTELRHPKGRSS